MELAILQLLQKMDVANLIANAIVNVVSGLLAVKLLSVIVDEKISWFRYHVWFSKEPDIIKCLIYFIQIISNFKKD